MFLVSFTIGTKPFTRNDRVHQGSHILTPLYVFIPAGQSDQCSSVYGLVQRYGNAIATSFLIFGIIKEAWELAYGDHGSYCDGVIAHVQ